MGIQCSEITEEFYFPPGIMYHTDNQSQTGALYQLKEWDVGRRHEGVSNGSSYMYQFSSVQSLSHVRLFATP